MPYINLQITKGATREQKAELVKDMTASLVRVLDKKPERIHQKSPCFMGSPRDMEELETYLKKGSSQ